MVFSRALKSAKEHALRESPTGWRVASMFKAWAREWQVAEDEAVEIFLECAKAGALSESWNTAIRNEFSQYSDEKLWAMVRGRRDLLDLFRAVGFEWPR